MNAYESQVKTRIYNIGGVNATMHQIADIVKKFIPDAIIQFTPSSSKNESYPLFIDVNARNELGWTPTYSLEEGIQETIELIRRRPHLYSQGVYTKDVWV